MRTTKMSELRLTPFSYLTADCLKARPHLPSAYRYSGRIINALAEEA
jgi:hypothetical protein